MSLYKNIMCFFLCIMISTTVCPCIFADTDYSYDSLESYSDTYQGNYEISSNILSLLQELKIMNGDPSGDFRLSDYVSRAEFTKIAVSASDYRNNVATTLSVSPFFDVPYTHWSAPYVRVGITNNIVSGYPDASFKPDDQVTYEEAVTILLRVLGYTDSDFGVAWPSGQIGMAESLDMTYGLTSTSVGVPMTRSDVAKLVYNTLRVKKKNSQDELITIFDIKMVEDVTLISTSKTDSSIPSDEVFTDNGSYKITNDFDYGYIGKKGDVALKDGKKIIGFFPDEDDSLYEKYAVYSTLSDSLIVYNKGTMQTLDINNGTTVYDGKNKTTYAAVKSDFEMGDILTVKKTNGDIDYITYQKGDFCGPYTAGDSSDWNNIGISSSTVVTRDGKISSKNDIQTYDIVYYIPQIDMAFVYTTKITGVYDKASPNKDNPTEVQISGTTYKVESSNAFKKLSSSGNISIGDTVTLLLGRTNQVADVIDYSQINSSIVGYAYETGSKLYTSDDLKEYSNYYIKVVTSNGETHTYTTNNNYEDYKNSVVQVTIDGGIAKISKVSSAPAGGNFSKDKMKLGDDTVADNVKILDIGTWDKNEPSLYTTVYPNRLDNVSINSNKILYCHKDINNQIDELILKDVTGDSFIYGIVTSATNVSMGMHSSGVYSYLVNGNSYSYSSSSSMFSVETGNAIKLSSAQNPSSMTKLSQLNDTSSVVNSTMLTSGGKNYILADNIQVYEKEYSSTSLYRMIPISNLVGNDDYSLTAYYDKLPSSGGRIRVIVAVKK